MCVGGLAPGGAGWKECVGGVIGSGNDGGGGEAGGATFGGDRKLWGGLDG